MAKPSRSVGVPSVESNPLRVLLAEADRDRRRGFLGKISATTGVIVDQAGTADEVLAGASVAPPHLAFLDASLRSGAGAGRRALGLMATLRVLSSATEVVLCVERADPEVAQAAEAAGAFAVLLKRELHERGRVAALLERRRARPDPPRGHMLLGASASMHRLRGMVAKVAAADELGVLVTGETGSGKEMVARAIHRASPRHAEPFVPINCAAMPGALVESELFGHERGAFTGAHARRRGAFALAGGGTLLLDEIGELGPDVQAKLLRVLDDGWYRPVGSEVEQRTVARVIAATNARLPDRVAQGTFRRDLFERLKTCMVPVPSLAERPEDIAMLARAFATEGRGGVRLTDDAIAFLCRRAWPGNVRELRGFVRSLVAMIDGDHVSGDDVAAHEVEPTASDVRRIAAAILALTVPRRWEVVEMATMQLALEQAEGNQSRAAERLGFERRAFHRRLVANDSLPSLPAAAGAEED